MYLCFARRSKRGQDTHNQKGGWHDNCWCNCEGWRDRLTILAYRIAYRFQPIKFIVSSNLQSWIYKQRYCDIAKKSLRKDPFDAAKNPPPPSKRISRLFWMEYSLFQLPCKVWDENKTGRKFVWSTIWISNRFRRKFFQLPEKDQTTLSSSEWHTITNQICWQ